MVGWLVGWLAGWLGGGVGGCIGLGGAGLGCVGESCGRVPCVALLQDEKTLRSIFNDTGFLHDKKREAVSPIMVVYDHKMAAESVTNPRQRVAPLREAHLQKMFGSYLEVHNAGGETVNELHPADEFVLYCGGKPGLLPALQKPFDKRKREVKAVTMMYVRDDMQARREKTPSGAVNQIEMQLRITADVPVRPAKQGAHYGCWSDGNGFGPIRLPAWGAKDTMMGTRDEKDGDLRGQAPQARGCWEDC